MLFCLAAEVPDSAEKLQKVPHKSRVGKTVEDVVVLPREATQTTENTSTSILITHGFIFAVYVPGYELRAKIEGCGNLCKAMHHVHLVNFNLYRPTSS